jgi:Uncharacterized alpha/beta hydrolase domain (DUF2235)
MPKNIVIFSDGTGQAGGITFDEVRTNIYKLYRACRVGPDTSIDPSAQVAFYDPGLGSPADGSKIKIQWARKIYNLASMATGLGITANIVDCYAALIRLYRDGDRVFLIGFSRGAYTIRSLAGVMSYCGVPRQLPNGDPLPMDIKGSRALAECAVKQVYQFCSSYNFATAGRHHRFLLQTRQTIAAKFRSEHGCSRSKNGVEQANVFPYFIGAFDTVAALGNKWLAPILVLLAAAIPVGLHFLGAFLEPSYPWTGWFTRYLGYSGVLIAALLYLVNYLKIAPSFAGFGFYERLKTLHFAEFKHRFYDTTLNVNVGYAKHAISIDENREDFARVSWSPTAEKQDQRDQDGNLYFEQVWFPGVHADIGGGYEENESRLSDNALAWMLAAASIVPNGLAHDETVMRLHPDPAGPQHDEQKNSWLALGRRKLPGPRAIMHKSVFRRYDAGPVVLYETTAAYRPVNLNEHVDFVQYYDPRIKDPQPANPAQTMADDIEEKWRRTQASSKLTRAIALLVLLGGLLTWGPASRAEEAGSTPAAAGTPTPTPTPTSTKQPAGAKQAPTAPAFQEPIPDCAGGEEFKNLANTTNSSAIVYSGNLVPAGTTVDFGLTTSLVANAHYFVLLLEGNSTPEDSTAEHGARARIASEADELVVKHLLSPGQTIVSYDVPRDAAGFWTKRNLYIYQCSNRRPLNVSYLPVYVSPVEWSIALTLLVGIAVYYAAARALRVVSGQSLTAHQSWNPIRITAGPDNRGSLSTLQVFFFTVLVFVMLAYVLSRTGMLSDLSTTVLELLGISGLGATAAKGADSSKTAIDPANQAWLLSKGWYDIPTVRPASQPTFYDLISSDGSFDVYRYQSFLFSAAVGGALFIGGISQLSSFTVPQNILGILGLSQVVYIAGKLVNPNVASQINSVITDLRNAEADFAHAALTYQPPGAAAPLPPPATLQDAINRAGTAAYGAYLAKATAAGKLFTSATGRVVDRQKLEPSVII